MLVVVAPTRVVDVVSRRVVAVVVGTRWVVMGPEDDRPDVGVVPNPPVPLPLPPLATRVVAGPEGEVASLA